MKNLLTFIFRKNEFDIESLNGLRALSITGVLVQHLWLIVQYNNIPRSHLIDNFFFNMKNFIDLFFVLSGFLIYGGLSRTFEKEGSIGFTSYFKKRTLRIFPAYYFFISIMYLFSYMQIRALSSLPVLNEGEKTVLAFLKNGIAHPVSDFLYISNYFPGNISHNWSLSIEEQFYIILPFFLVFFLFKQKRENRIYSLLALYLVPLIIRVYLMITTDNAHVSSIHIYIWTHTRFDSLLVGIIVYEMYSLNLNSYQRLQRLSPIVYLAILLLSSATFLIGSLDSPIFYSTIRYNLSNISFGLLLVLALDNSTNISKFLSFSMFRPIARISYTTYLWHIAFGGIVFHSFMKINNEFS
jgi:peptidoglycan/LPS O-acetylase OafA/YrhL